MYIAPSAKTFMAITPMLLAAATGMTLYCMLKFMAIIGVDGYQHAFENAPAVALNHLHHHVRAKHALKTRCGE